MASTYFSSPHNIDKRRVNEKELLEKISPVEIFTRLPIEYKDMILQLFPRDSLKDANGYTIPHEHLIKKSVGIYFAVDNNPKCNSFLPFLLRYYKTMNEAGINQKIEIIFISLDKTEEAFQAHRKKMPWLNVELSDPTTKRVIRHFQILDEPSMPKYASGSRLRPPALIVIGGNGEPSQYLPIEYGREEGRRGILRWDWRNMPYEPPAPKN